MTRFADRCKVTAQRFIQTAVVIDNEAELGPAPQSTPKVAVRPSPSILAMATKQEEMAAEETKQPDESGPTAETVSSHALNAKELTDAFLGESIICGLYKPLPTEEMVEMSAKAALNADLVIVDWILADNSSEKAREIIARIIESDQREAGRLRLISVYTSEPDLRNVCRTLFDHIESRDELRGKYSIVDAGSTITGRDTRICFYNKSNTVGAIPGREVTEGELPAKLLVEFARMTEGVLSNFVVGSIAAVRRATHHIISVFNRGLDGAFLSHRCSLPNPEDATEFALELVTSELQSVISTQGVHHDCLGLDALNDWVDDRQQANTKFLSHDGAEAGPDLVKRFLNGGQDVVEDSKALQFTAGTDQPIRDGRPYIKVENVHDIFYKSKKDAWESGLEFARIATFKRERSGRSPLPAGWQPILTLGSVVKMVRPEGSADDPLYKDLASDYLICVQPKCDSMRLNGPTYFPFQNAKVADKAFNLVVNDNSSSGLPLMVGYKPSESVNLRFEPEAADRPVKAQLDGDEFIFTDTLGRKFVWLGDIKDLKAQRDASMLAARLHSVGIDDFEWLRRAEKRKAQIPRFAPQ